MPVAAGTGVRHTFALNGSATVRASIKRVRVRASIRVRVRVRASIRVTTRVRASKKGYDQG